MSIEPRDPFRNCQETCHHDLAMGVLVSELLAAEGPHIPGWVWLGSGPAALVLMDEAERPAA